MTEASSIDNDGVPWYRRRRYYLCSLFLLAYYLVFVLRTNMSIAIVSMTNTRNETLENGTEIQVTDFEWNSKEKGWVLSSYFFGFATTQLVGGWLASRIGMRKLMLFCIFLPSLITLATPYFSRFSIAAMIVSRILNGFFAGPVFTCNFAFIYRWIPPAERSRIVNLAFIGVYAGTLSMLAVGGSVVNTLGWEWTFYIPGILSLIWCVLWILFSSDDYENDKFISAQEVEYLRKTVGKVVGGKEIKHPWKSFFTSKACWAIFVSHFLCNWIFYNLYTQYPSFLKETLQFDIETAGYISALPNVSMLFLSTLTAFFSDYVISNKIIGAAKIRKISMFISSIIQMFCYGSIMIIEDPTSIVCCISVALTSHTLMFFTCQVNWIDIAPPHSSVLFGISNTMAIIAGSISPTVTGYIVTEKLLSQWRIIFIILTAMNLFTSIFYPALSSAEIQPWSIQQKLEPS